MAGASSRVRGAGRLVPASAGGVLTRGGALNPPPLDAGGEGGEGREGGKERRGAEVRMSSGFASDHGRSGGGKGAGVGAGAGEGDGERSGGGFKAS